MKCGRRGGGAGVKPRHGPMLGDVRRVYRLEYRHPRRIKAALSSPPANRRGPRCRRGALRRAARNTSCAEFEAIISPGVDNLLFPHVCFQRVAAARSLDRRRRRFPPFLFFLNAALCRSFTGRLPVAASMFLKRFFEPRLARTKRPKRF